MEHSGSPRWGELATSDFEEMAARYGTPFYLYDVDVFKDTVSSVRNAFENRVCIYYAVKANPNLELLRSIKSSVDGLDISSGGELEQCLRAGYDPSCLSFAGPAKTADELRPAVENGIGLISIESERELREVVAISKQIGKQANVGIRINPVLDSKAFGLKMGGRPMQFGIDEEHLDSIIQIVLANKSTLNFKGIHIYAGSQGFDHNAVADSIRNTFRIAKNLESEAGLICNKINLGGGFGISHSGNEKFIDLMALGACVSPQLHELDYGGECRRELIFELGRYLIANAGLYVVRVVSTKISRGKSYAVVDGGLNHHLAAAGMFGVGLRSNYFASNLTRPEFPTVACNIAGPSCNPTDLLGVNINIAEPTQGDLISIMRSGSYGFTASPLLFLGHPTPAELIRSNGKITLGRKSLSMQDFN